MIIDKFNPFPALETERCFLSLITEKHKAEIYKIYSDIDVMQFMQRPAFTDINQALELINQWETKRIKNEAIRWGVFSKDNPSMLIGTIALQYWNKSSNSIEVGADLLKEYWGKGLAFEFTKPVIAFAFEELNINRLELRCDPNNIASNRIAQKFGLTFEGTLREYVYIDGKGYVDESVNSILRSEYLK